MPGSPGPAGSGDGDTGLEEAARLICLRLLAAGPRTRAQLSDALRRRRVPEEAADAVLERLAEVGLIDDSAFAQAWVETRHHGRGLARRALSAELRRRGLKAEDVRAAVGVISSEEELATARQLVARKLPGTRGRPLPARIRQLVAMLARKGYPADLAYRVVREALEEDGQQGIDRMLGSCDAAGDLLGMAEGATELEEVAAGDEPAECWQCDV